MPEHDLSGDAAALLGTYRTAAPDARAHLTQALLDVLAPLIYAKARQAFQSVGMGAVIASPDDLANAWIVDIMSKDELLPGFDLNAGHSLGGYIYTSLVHRGQQERRTLRGSNKKIPRVFVSEGLDGADAYAELETHRRSPSAYLQLRQMCNILPRYLKQIPGKVVTIKTATGSKQTILTREHSRLLSIWLGAEGSKTWQEVADEMQRPRKTVTRWFDEIKAHFKSDTSADAALLRSLVDFAREDDAIDE